MDEKPVTRADLNDLFKMVVVDIGDRMRTLEARIVELLRDTQTAMLRAFDAGPTAAGRLDAIERRLAELERRLLEKGDN